MKIGMDAVATINAVKYTDYAFTASRPISGLMVNFGGSTTNKRRLLISVTHSIPLYGYMIWMDGLIQDEYRKQMAAIQRRRALHVAISYRTVPELTMLVVPGAILIDLVSTKVEM